MRLLFDNNLSPKLVSRLAEHFPNSNHVSLLGLDTASDVEVWNFAKGGGYCLVTKDADFNELLVAKGFPPKIIWIRLGNCTTDAIDRLLNNHLQSLLDFDLDENAGILELQ